MSDFDSLYPMGTLLGDAIPGAPLLAQRGTIPAGVCTIQLMQPGQADVLAGKKDGHYPRYDRTLTVEVWYPALLRGNETHAVYTDHLGRVDLENLKPYTIQGRAFRDAVPDPEHGPYPVVVLSHGYPGSRMLLVNLAENLSGKGYVVLSIGHTDNTYEDFPKEGSLESALIHRSLDQRFVISSLKAMNTEGFLKGMLQPENVGLVGFSMGGYGALRTIGACFSDQALQMAAGYADELADPEDFRGLPEVKAAVLFAPAVFWFDAAKSENITVPTLWICGTADRTVYYQMVHDFCEKATHSERMFVSYEGCGHNVANNPAPAEALGTDWETLKRWADPVWDTLRLNSNNFHFVTAFLEDRLKGDKSHASWLRPHVSIGRNAVWAMQSDGTEAPEHTYWKGFSDGTAYGIVIEHFEKE